MAQPKNREWIEMIVENIMILDGPDAHCDGSGIITDFIEALLAGREEDWVKQYRPQHHTFGSAKEVDWDVD